MTTTPLRSAATLLVAVALLLAPVSLDVAARAADGHAVSKLDKDCADFPTQAAAQRYFLSRGGPQSDPDALDADGDGIACESNPCPCSTDQGGGNGGGGGGTEPSKPPRKIERGRILRVVDGDTVDVRLDRGRKVRVRMIGIDTPEVYGGIECGGKQASKTLTRLLPKRTRVKLVSDRTQDLKDRYGRVLRYVYKNGRRDMNKTQLALGNAEVYVYDNVRFERYKGYAKAQAVAKRRNKGIWKNCR